MLQDAVTLPPGPHPGSGVALPPALWPSLEPSRGVIRTQKIYHRLLSQSEIVLTTKSSSSTAMAEIPFNNVFKGPESVINYFDPDLQPPLPLVELPAKLNHFRSDGVRIYAKMLTATPAQNVKVFPGNHHARCSQSLS